MKILIRLWTIWCFTVAPFLFFIYAILMILLIMIPLNVFTYIFYQITPYFSTFLLFIMGVKINLTGFNPYVQKDPTIYISNHKSYLDIFIISAMLPGKLKYLGKAEVFKWPVFGWLAKISGQIPVQRESKESRAYSYDLMKLSLEQGYSIILFPEGGWKNNNDKTSSNPYNFTKDKMLQDFRNGAFRLSMDTQCHIVPIVLLNAQKRFSDLTKQMIPGIADVHVFKPIDPKDFSNIEDLNNKCFNLTLGKLNDYKL